MAKFRYKFYLHEIHGMKCKFELESFSLEMALNTFNRHNTEQQWMIRKIKIRRLTVNA